MGFSSEIKEKVMLACARHCCVCQRYAGVNMEVHHIKPHSEGGLDTFDNAIPLCYECHAFAGHYNPKHPKGIKYSPIELNKARDVWYKIVKKGKISDIDISNVIWERHIITTKYEDIINYNKEKLPLENCMFFDTIASKFLKKLTLNKQYQCFSSIINKKISTSDYLIMFPNAVKSEYDMYQYRRVPSDEEIAEIGKSDSFIKFLYDNKISKEQIVEIGAYYESRGCGGDDDDTDSLIETINSRSFLLQTISFMNINSEPIQLQELKVMSYDKSILVKTDSIIPTTPTLIRLPKISLLPSQSIIIPTAVISSGFNNLNHLIYKIINEQIVDELYKSFSFGILDNPSSIEYIGPFIIPMQIKYQIEKTTVQQEIHPIDYNALYWIDEGYACGSCPYLFFETKEHKLLYQKELFKNEPNKYIFEEITIPNNIVSIVIAELENETTYIDTIQINDCITEVNAVLTKQDYFKKEVQSGNKVIIKGKYQFHGKKFVELETSEKHKLISTFVKNYEL